MIMEESLYLVYKKRKKSTKIEWLKKLSPETTLFLFLFFLPRSVENKILILMIM